MMWVEPSTPFASDLVSIDASKRVATNNVPRHFLGKAPAVHSQSEGMGDWAILGSLSAAERFLRSMPAGDFLDLFPKILQGFK